MNLGILGWDLYKKSLKENIEEDFVARVAVENRGGYLLCTKEGELEGIVQGKFRQNAKSEVDFPKVGDWVLIEKLAGEKKAIIKEILPRVSKISRKKAGEDITEQIIATNVDFAFIIQGLDGDFNIGKMERFVAMAKEGGCEPVILLNKCDISSEGENKLEDVKKMFPGVKAFAISAKNNTGIDQIRSFISEGQSVVFVGSSGAGKSTLINSLLGFEKQETAEIRQDDSRGRHTTTKREMIFLPTGGVLIDTPGMRELGLWASQDSLNETFDDIDALASRCKYNDCRHEIEKGCAVIEAVENGEISRKRYARYIKLKNALDLHGAKKKNNLEHLQKRSRQKTIKRAEHGKTR